jgi:branched-chain amino acid transport system ATP-binding protein
VLERTGLPDVVGAPAGDLPLLRRKRLELARAVALRPRLLLLDEIGAGLVEHEVAELVDLVRQLRAEVEAVLIVEHVMEIVTARCERTVVLDSGRLVTQGPTRQVLADPAVAAAYLGTAGRPNARCPGARRLGAPRPPAVRPSRPARTAGGGPLLAVRAAAVSYGGVRALRGVDLDVGAGEVVALLGANGAGKTTLARALSGAVPLDAGSISFAGRRLDGLPPDRIVALGIAHCMEGRRIFGTLSVEENLRLAADGSGRAEVARRLARVYDAFPALAGSRSLSGTALSGGQQQLLAIGRALMSGPRLVIFDEVSLGLAPVAVERVY